ncbi:type II toxin-antitoxin system RelE/ParE family toxin [Flagellimonas amoyensis]|uniref:type II toxin-antitoxin system RelE/ParE family toxin n=1 Tax=Flagellimonas amoyensis TaxID=2169401 RepID=UPI00131F249E|nr:type II toxin-antitoxin system RelE/ParE family toxin [Allomuricauda amoyensis]
MKVVWTFEAEKSFNAILDYLMEVWSQKEALAFIDLVEETIENIRTYPEMFKVSPYNRVSREAFITKHTTMFYRILDELIEVEYFWGNFQDPDNIEKLLS